MKKLFEALSETVRKLTSRKLELVSEYLVPAQRFVTEIDPGFYFPKPFFSVLA